MYLEFIGGKRINKSESSYLIMCHERFPNHLSKAKR